MLNKDDMDYYSLLFDINLASNYLSACRNIAVKNGWNKGTLHYYKPPVVTSGLGKIRVSLYLVLLPSAT